PASSSLSSTVESFSGPRQRPLLPPRPPPLPIPDGDCRSDCGSSASVVDDDCTDAAASQSCRLPLPFDLNLPPGGCGFVCYGDEEDELRLTALRLCPRSRAMVSANQHARASKRLLHVPCTAPAAAPNSVCYSADADGADRNTFVGCTQLGISV
ncbi:hypothetical protein EJB05_57426, partial [Eragrostis curvula]